MKYGWKINERLAFNGIAFFESSSNLKRSYLDAITIALVEKHGT